MAHSSGAALDPRSVQFLRCDFISGNAEVFGYGRVTVQSVNVLTAEAESLVVRAFELREHSREPHLVSHRLESGKLPTSFRLGPKPGVDHDGPDSQPAKQSEGVAIRKIAELPRQVLHRRRVEGRSPEDDGSPMVGRVEHVGRIETMLAKGIRSRTAASSSFVAMWSSTRPIRVSIPPNRFSIPPTFVVYAFHVRGEETQNILAILSSVSHPV